jgi:hypothetical protein
LLRWNLDRRKPRIGRRELSWKISRHTKISARGNGKGKKRKRRKKKNLCNDVT